jgi:hypothetical protein
MNGTHFEVQKNGCLSANETISNFARPWIVQSVVIFPFLILGTIGNVLVFLSVCRTVGRKNPLELLIMTQCISDFILSAVVYPSNAMAILTNYVTANPITANIFGSLFIVCQTSSTLAICCVAVNRMGTIVFFLRVDRRIQFRMSVIGIFFCWALPVSFVLPVLLGLAPGVHMLGRGNGAYPMGATRVAHPGEENLYVRHLMSMDIVCIVFPSFITAVCYLMIWKFVRGRNRQTGELRVPGQPQTNKDRLLRKRILSAKMSCVIAVTFLVCYYPYVISVTKRKGISPDADHMGEMFVTAVLSCLFWFGCCVNPFIYGSLNKGFKGWLSGWVQVLLRPIITRQPGENRQAPSGDDATAIGLGFPNGISWRSTALNNP